MPGSFVLKVASPLHVGQDINLSTFFAPPHPTKDEERLHRLHPKRVLSFYIDRTREHRVDDQLFVGFAGTKKGKADPLSMDCTLHKNLLCTSQEAAS